MDGISNWSELGRYLLSFRMLLAVISFADALFYFFSIAIIVFMEAFASKCYISHLYSSFFLNKYLNGTWNYLSWSWNHWAQRKKMLNCKENCWKTVISKLTIAKVNWIKWRLQNIWVLNKVVLAIVSVLLTCLG